MSVFDFLRGISEYRIEINDREEFINSVNKNISVKNLKLEKDGTLSFSCFCEEAKTLEDVASQNGGKIINKRNRGVPVFMQRLKHRAGLVTGLAVSVCIVMLSTLFVWEIRVEGNEYLEEKQVVEMLDKAGFREGMIKSRIDVKKITDRVLVNEDAVSWMAINFDGTVAHVEMKEAKIARSVSKKENVNLVASADGIILRVDAHEGGTKVAKGDAVVRGQLLVSAFVDKRTGGSMLRGARGFVWANTQRSFGVVVPLECMTKKYTGDNTKIYSLTFLGKTLTFENPLSKGAKNCEFAYTEDKMRLFEKFVLPVKVKTVVKNTYEHSVVRRTKQSALEIARKSAKERLSEISPDFVQLSYNEDYTFEDNVLIYKCSFDGIENIAKELEFELS